MTNYSKVRSPLTRLNKRLLLCKLSRTLLNFNNPNWFNSFENISLNIVSILSLSSLFFMQFISSKFVIYSCLFLSFENIALRIGLMFCFFYWAKTSIFIISSSPSSFSFLKSCSKICFLIICSKSYSSFEKIDLSSFSIISILLFFNFNYYFNEF